MTHAQRNPLARTAFTLWCVAAAVLVGALALGLLAGALDPSSVTDRLAVVILPIGASVVWVPLLIAALVAAIVAVRRPGLDHTLAGATVVLSVIGLLAAVVPAVGALVIFMTT